MPARCLTRFMPHFIFNKTRECGLMQKRRQKRHDVQCNFIVGRGGGGGGGGGGGLGNCPDTLSRINEALFSINHFKYVRK